MLKIVNNQLAKVTHNGGFHTIASVPAGTSLKTAKAVYNAALKIEGIEVRDILAAIIDRVNARSGNVAAGFDDVMGEGAYAKLASELHEALA